MNLLDHFIHCGPNGEHICLVLELLGPSVHCVLLNSPLCRNSSKSWHRLYRLHITRRILRDAASDLATLYSSGIAHGDFHLNNIVFTVRDVESVPVEELEQSITTEGTELRPLDSNDVEEGGGYPRLLFEPRPLHDYADISGEDRVPLVKIADLGAGE